MKVLILVLLLAGTAHADPVVYGGTATVTYNAVFSFTALPVFTFNVTNTSANPLAALTDIGFAWPSAGRGIPGMTAAQHALFTLEGDGVLNLVPAKPFPFTVELALMPGSTAVFSITGYWFFNGTALTNVQDLMHIYFLPPPRSVTIPLRSALATTETPELGSMLLLGSGLIGAAGAIRKRRRMSCPLTPER